MLIVDLQACATIRRLEELLVGMPHSHRHRSPPRIKVIAFPQQSLLLLRSATLLGPWPLQPFEAWQGSVELIGGEITNTCIPRNATRTRQRRRPTAATFRIDAAVPAARSSFGREREAATGLSVCLRGEAQSGTIAWQIKACFAQQGTAAGVDPTTADKTSPASGRVQSLRNLGPRSRAAARWGERVQHRTGGEKMQHLTAGLGRDPHLHRTTAVHDPPRQRDTTWWQAPQQGQGLALELGALGDFGALPASPGQEDFDVVVAFGGLLVAVRRPPQRVEDQEAVPEVALILRRPPGSDLLSEGALGLARRPAVSPQGLTESGAHGVQLGSLRRHGVASGIVRRRNKCPAQKIEQGSSGGLALGEGIGPNDRPPDMRHGPEQCCRRRTRV
mmetsp:Transcript_16458/g.52823  ORF Transcript_16458/g.52823 Transcript_16458/m.52823 type:complete len:389 (+) Transcript_16458:306-1472(+)